MNEWFDHTLYSRLNDKRTGSIIIMQRLHEDDLVGHVLNMEPWKVIRFPAIAEEDEAHSIQTPYGVQRHERRAGEALHPEREPLEVLKRIREVQGEYTFSAQYQQAPAPLGGGMVKVATSVFVRLGALRTSIFFSCTFIVKRHGYPDLKRAVKEQAEAFGAQIILIEDKSSGTSLIQELVSEGMHAVTRYEPTVDKIMRMHSVASTIENGFIHLPDKAAWRGEYLHELATFPKGKYDDQADSTSQALDWFRSCAANYTYGLIEYLKREAMKQATPQSTGIRESMECPKCRGVMNQRIPGGLRCANCGEQWSPPGLRPQVYLPNRKDYFNRTRFRWR
jgi:predicted phage terminase large subunit-like protein